MLRPGERVKLIPRDASFWEPIRGDVIEDDGSDLRIRYKTNGRVSVIPWETIAAVYVQQVTS